jgi:hypothetical protein
MSSYAWIGLPNLSVWNAKPFTNQWRQFDQHWPYTVPSRLELFLREFGISFQCSSVNDAPQGAWYPIGISWWNLDLDYVSLIPAATKDRIRQGHVRLLFYYHEGDNPARIRNHIDNCLDQHGIARNSTLLISANSAAANIPGCSYFDDFECWLTVLNKDQKADLPIRGTRPFDFTVLSRTHKWWRATVMNDLKQSNLLANSIWGYGNVDCGDQWAENPINCADRELEIRKFVECSPWVADELDHYQQNDHHCVNSDLYTKSYFHIVLETHFDADQSGGAFLTEKTYKCIKYGQPFFVVGPSGSLEVLRSHGYRVFDDVLDNSYDHERDNTLRWQKLCTAIKKASISCHDTNDACLADVLHNQKLFVHRPKDSVTKLLEGLK